jgi:hypothetical protein
MTNINNTLPEETSNDGRKINGWLVGCGLLLIAIILLVVAAIFGYRYFTRGEVSNVDPATSAQQDQISWDDMSLDNWKKTCTQLMLQTDPTVELILAEGKISCIQVIALEDDQVPVFVADDNQNGTAADGNSTDLEAEAANESSLKGTGTKPKFVTDFNQGDWEVYGTDRLEENPVVEGWIKRLEDPAPEKWATFPNIPNPDVPDFRVVNGDEVPDGVEYGTYSTPYCFSHPCDVPVGAWEYRLITGDYDVFGYECRGDMQKGCLLLLINVMDQSVTFRDQDVDNGFTLRGRYWNGDSLEWGTWGLVSHASANMLNMPTFAREGEVLNAGDPGNSGANCGTPTGCREVDARVIVVAGDAPIAVLETVVQRPTQ